MLIVQQRMLYQKHSLRILIFRVQMFFFNENSTIYLVFVAGTVG